MTRVSPALTVAIVLVANAFALAHVWRNRAATPESDITLTQRELYLPFTTVEDDSGVTLNLRWNNPQYDEFGEQSMPWMDAKTLRGIGFDTSVPVSETRASEFYQRQLPRRAYVALEYDGPAWQRWSANLERKTQDAANPAVAKSLLDTREASSRLVAIDAGSDAAQLRARHPDRRAVIVVPAVIRIYLDPGFTRRLPNLTTREARLVGMIEDVPGSVHVPRPFSDGFRGRKGNDTDPPYVVHLRYGSSFEPWIVGVDFPKSH